MSSLLSRFLSKIEFESYEEFRDNFRITVPVSFNFAFDVVDVYAEELPDKVAIHWCNDSGEEKIFTFKDLSYLSNRAANLFLRLGVTKGDAVMLILKSRYDFWISMIALHKIGAIAVPSTHILSKKEIVYRIRSAEIRMIICIGESGVPKKVDAAAIELGDTALVKMLVGKQDQLRDGWVNFRRELEESSQELKRPAGTLESKNEDILLAYFTSGTSDIPKFVKHDHTYPLGHILTAKYWQNVVEDGLHYTVAETGWAKSMWGSIYGQWIAGSAVFVYDYKRFDPKKVLEKMSHYGVTTFCAPPTIYGSLIKEDMSMYDLSNLRYAVSAGEPLTPGTYKKFLEKTGLGLMEGYGQTETAVVIANFPWVEPKPGSMGKQSPEYDVILVDENDKVCEVGGEGEIVIKTEKGKPLGLCVDYHLENAGPNRGWHEEYYHTGDIAWMDEDGHFWFVGRREDIIKSSGYRIGTFEVESALLSHPAVLECAITGVPDPTRGKIVKATVVLTEGYLPGEELKNELQNHVKSETAPYKYPRIIEFATELPKTISGKIRRIDIREKDKPYPVINELECKACERCILACPVNVLELGSEFNERGYRFVVYAGEDCIGCGNCFYTCPEPLAIEVHIPVKEAS